MVTVQQHGTNVRQLAFMFGLTLLTKGPISDIVFTSMKCLKTRYLDRWTEVRQTGGKIAFDDNNKRLSESYMVS